MDIKRLGKEWGAAHEEAQPIEVSYGNARFESFVTENYDLRVNLPSSAKIEWTGNGFSVTIPSEFI